MFVEGANPLREPLSEIPGDLKRARYLRGTVYTIRESEPSGAAGDRFFPTFDNRRRLHFACFGCRNPAEIHTVTVHDSDGTANPLMVFHLDCLSCGYSGQLEVSLSAGAEACSGHMALDYESKRIDVFPGSDVPLGRETFEVRKVKRTW